MLFGYRVGHRSHVFASKIATCDAAMATTYLANQAVPRYWSLPGCQQPNKRHPPFAIHMYGQTSVNGAPVSSHSARQPCQRVTAEKIAIQAHPNQIQTVTVLESGTSFPVSNSIHLPGPHQKPQANTRREAMNQTPIELWLNAIIFGARLQSSVFLRPRPLRRILDDRWVRGVEHSAERLFHAFSLIIAVATCREFRRDLDRL